MARITRTERAGATTTYRAVAVYAAVAAANLATIAFARAISRTTTEGVPLWAAAGVTMAVLLVAGRRLVPGVLAVTFGTNLGANLVLGIGAATAIGGTLANTIEPLVGVAIVVGLAGPRTVLGGRRGLVVFIGAVVAAPAIAAVVGAASIQLTPGHPPFFDVFGRWFVGDALGVLVVGSLLLAWLQPGDETNDAAPRWPEVMIAGAAVVGLAVLAFWGGSPTLAYLVLPPLAFVAIRFGVRGATLGGLAVAVVADWATIEGHGLFVVLVGLGEHEALWQLQLFLAVLLTTSLVLAVQVTELHAAQRALRSSEEQERMGSMLESSPDAVLVVRPDSTVEYVNEQMLALLERDRDETIGRSFVEFIDPSRRPEMLEILRFMRGQPVGSRSTFEVVGVGDALDLALEAAVSPINTLAGPMFVASIRDVTDRNAAEAELRAARDTAEAATTAKTEFLATMSHEIRTPLSAVTNLMELLDRSDLDDDQRALLDTAQRSAAALLRIVDDSLDLSKIEAGKLELDTIPLALDEELLAVASLMEPVASTKGLTLTCATWPQQPPLLLGDGARLRQVLLNLVGNAVKFTETGAVDVVAAVDQTDRDEGALVDVTLVVRDTGIGIDEGEQTKLFDPFTQADQGLGRRYGGTGLGLSIVRQLVELMGGTIELASVPNVGTTVTVRLALAVAPAGATPPAGEPEAGDVDYSRTSGHLVLVAEDNVVNRDVVVRQLAMLGCGANAVGDGREALARLDRGGISLLLTDCHMPELDGFALARAIRRHEAQLGVTGTHLPVVALTASAMLGESERCREAGMDACLTKPVTLERLGHVLADHLPSEPARSEQVLDLAMLHETVGGDEQAVTDVLADFPTSVHDSVAQVRDGLSARDRHAVRRAAHDVLGCARAVGADRLAALAAAVELGAQGASREGLDAAVGWLIEEAGIVVAATERVRSGHG